MTRDLVGNANRVNWLAYRKAGTTTAGRPQSFRGDANEAMRLIREACGPAGAWLVAYSFFDPPSGTWREPVACERFTEASFEEAFGKRWPDVLRLVETALKLSHAHGERPPGSRMSLLKHRTAAMQLAVVRLKEWTVWSRITQMLDPVCRQHLKPDESDDAPTTRAICSAAVDAALAIRLREAAEAVGQWPAGAERTYRRLTRPWRFATGQKVCEGDTLAVWDTP